MLFKNEKMERLYNALVDVLGEDKVGWQDAGEDYELIELTINLKNELDNGEKNVKEALWIDTTGAFVWGERIPNIDELNLISDCSIWAFETYE